MTMTDNPTNGLRADFKSQTENIRRWVNGESVLTTVLAVELMAWANYVRHGMSLTSQVKMLSEASALLNDILQPDAKTEGGQQ